MVCFLYLIIFLVYCSSVLDSKKQSSSSADDGDKQNKVEKKFGALSDLSSFTLHQMFNRAYTETPMISFYPNQNPRAILYHSHGFESDANIYIDEFFTGNAPPNLQNFPMDTVNKEFGRFKYLESEPSDFSGANFSIFAIGPTYYIKHDESTYYTHSKFLRSLTLLPKNNQSNINAGQEPYFFDKAIRLVWVGMLNFASASPEIERFNRISVNIDSDYVYKKGRKVFVLTDTNKQPNEIYIMHSSLDGVDYENKFNSQTLPVGWTKDIKVLKKKFIFHAVNGIQWFLHDYNRDLFLWLEKPNEKAFVTAVNSNDDDHDGSEADYKKKNDNVKIDL